MAKIESNLRFSVIIPLEFHRGQVEVCLRRWAHEQTYSRDQYEIVAVGCPRSLDEETIALFKSLLSDHDRLLLYDEPHDIALCALAAKDAREEILIFTESHCLPEVNALSLTNDILHAHPEWAGFSGSTQRVIHNRLSAVEADMYESDIRFGMEKHPWLKLLDQYFAVWAKKYHDADGFCMGLGHFAEWHLAAKMHEKGYQIGYAPEVQVQHYYSGDIHELMEFTKDFIYGEMTLHSSFLNDPGRLYFQEPIEWTNRYQWHSDFSHQVFYLAQYARFKPLWKTAHPYNFLVRFKLLLVLGWRKYASIRPLIFKANAQFQITKCFFSLALLPLIGINFLSKMFLGLIERVISLERIRFVKNWLNENDTLNTDASITKLTWRPDILCPFPTAGFHATEEWKGHKFKWSEPVGIIKIPLMPGTYQLEITWLPIKRIENLILYINEKPIFAIRKDTTLSMSFQVTSTSPTYFALTCEPWMGRNDKRLLGVPITSISITAQS